ncbi:ATP-binding protein [Ekhidna sp.]|uniref:ATP-binding protein n=1 Tax=Ekhidna sp. TaxID=2608089 RepID=UPI003511F4E2
MKPNLKLIALVAGLSMYACQPAKNQESSATEAPKPVSVSLELVWETDSVLMTCEAVRYNPEDGMIYVSNIGVKANTEKDGDGSISKISTAGEVLDLNWVTGLNGPKGSAISGGSLFVTDIDEVVEIELASGTILNKTQVDSAVFLNDLDARNGSIQFTDTGRGKIHLLGEGGATEKLDMPKFAPNGIFIEEERVLVVSYGTGAMVSIDNATMTVDTLATGMKGGDGIVAIDEGYLVSTWQGEVFFVEEGNDPVKILDTTEEKLNAADITIVPEQNLLIVPTFFGNKVMAYRINVSTGE